MRNLKKLFILCSLALVFTVMFADASFAAAGNGGVMNLAAGKAVQMFNHVKMIIFVIGGFGLVGIAFQAIFGKVKWTWFAGLAIGLAILAAAGAIVNYATGAKMGDGATGAQVKDTFSESGTGV
ncbi:MAG: TrbC/VirB2 family protein [Alphaproteobacteria bacterium]|nr:TrbC/VirB2 family protein [Alphaproteobacteria bacterium]